MLEVDRVHLIDAMKGLAQLADESVDLVCTDPPYNLGSPDRVTIRHGKVMSTLEAWGAWDRYDPVEYDAWITAVITECYRVLKPGGALYMFTAREDNGFFIRRAVQSGFVYRNQVLILKKNPQPSLAKANWRSGFEVCFYVTKGKPGIFNFLTQAEMVNVYAHAVRHKQSDHPTEKPLGLIQRLVLVSSRPGDLVLDPFMGSGTTAVAAKAAGRRFLGFDTSAEYIEMANARLDDTAAADDGTGNGAT